MTYIYSVLITPNTKEDVNLAFREAGILAELIVGEGGDMFLAPVLSWSEWQFFPQTINMAGQIDPRWDGAVASGLKYMSEQGWLTADHGMAEWKAFNISMRCAKMESFQRSKDLPLLADFIAAR